MGPAGNARLQGDPPRMAAHDLQDHDPLVAAARGVQPVHGVGGDLHRGLVAKGVVRAFEVVVDGLGDADHVGALELLELVGQLQASLAAHHEETVQAQILVRLQRLVRVVAYSDLAVFVILPVGEGVALVRRAQDRAAQRQNVLDAAGCESLGAVEDQPVEAVLDADDLGAVLDVRRAGHGANDGVEAGAVAAASENAYAFERHGFLLGKSSGAGPWGPHL